MSTAKETQDILQQLSAKNLTGTKTLPFPRFSPPFFSPFRSLPTALPLATGWRVAKAPFFTSAWPMRGTTRHTLFWPWNEVSWDGIKSALYKQWTIWRHNMLRIMTRRVTGSVVARHTTNEWQLRVRWKTKQNKETNESLKGLVYLQIKWSMSQRRSVQACTGFQQEMRVWGKCEGAWPHGQYNMHREPGSAIVCLVVSSVLFSRELIMHETRIVYVCLYVPTHRETKGGSRHGLHIGFHKLGMGGKG